MKTSQLKQAVICGAMLLGSTIVSAEVLTLQRTYELAQQNDPQWAAAKNTYQANQQVIDQNRSGLLPQINLTGNYRQNDVEYEDLCDDDYDSHG